MFVSCRANAYVFYLLSCPGNTQCGKERSRWAENIDDDMWQLRVRPLGQRQQYCEPYFQICRNQALHIRPGAVVMLIVSRTLPQLFTKSIYIYIYGDLRVDGSTGIYLRDMRIEYAYQRWFIYECTIAYEWMRMNCMIHSNNLGQITRGPRHEN